MKSAIQNFLIDLKWMVLGQNKLQCGPDFMLQVKKKKATGYLILGVEG